jgi:hypothetical protein
VRSLDRSGSSDTSLRGFRAAFSLWRYGDFSSDASMCCATQYDGPVRRGAPRSTRQLVRYERRFAILSKWAANSFPHPASAS